MVRILPEIGGHRDETTHLMTFKTYQNYRLTILVRNFLNGFHSFLTGFRQNPKNNRSSSAPNSQVLLSPIIPGSWENKTTDAIHDDVISLVTPTNDIQTDEQGASLSAIVNVWIFWDLLQKLLTTEVFPFRYNSLQEFHHRNSEAIYGIRMSGINFHRLPWREGLATSSVAEVWCPT